MEWGPPVNFETAVLAKYICSKTVRAFDFLIPFGAN
jgi:hypothetical protein